MMTYLLCCSLERIKNKLYTRGIFLSALRREHTLRKNDGSLDRLGDFFKSYYPNNIKGMN